MRLTIFLVSITLCTCCYAEAEIFWRETETVKIKLKVEAGKITGRWIYPKATDIKKSEDTAIVKPTDKTNDDYHFRKVTWGMSTEQVIASEGDLNLNANESQISKFVTKYGIKAMLFYDFKEDKLIAAGYVFLHFMDLISNVRGKYFNAKKRLEVLHGKKETDYRWTIEKDSKEVDKAIMGEDLALINRWDFPKTRIIHQLSAAEGRKIHAIRYISDEERKRIDSKPKK